MTSKKATVSAPLDLRCTDTIPSHRWPTEPMSSLAIYFCLWLFVCKEDLSVVKLVTWLVRNVTPMGVFSTFRVDVRVWQVLTAERAHKLVFFKLSGIPVNESSPFIHLMSGLFIEFLLVEIVFFLDFLRQLPDQVVFKFKQLALFLVVF